MARHRRRHSLSRRRNPSGKDAGRAALAILGAGVAGAVINKYMTDLATVTPTGRTAPRMTVKSAKGAQVALGLVAGAAAAAYGYPMAGAAVGAALVAPAAQPLYDAFRAPAANPYMMSAGLPAAAYR